MPEPLPGLLDELKTWLVFLGVCVGIPGLVVWGIWRLVRSIQLDYYRERLASAQAFHQPLATLLDQLKGLPSHAPMASADHEALLAGVPAARERVERLLALYPEAESALDEKRSRQAKKLVGRLERGAPEAAVELGGLVTALRGPREDGSDDARAIARRTADYARRFGKVYRMHLRALDVAKEDREGYWPNQKLLAAERELNEGFRHALAVLTRIPMSLRKADAALQHAESARTAYRKEYWKDLFFNMHKGRNLDYFGD